MPSLPAYYIGDGLDFSPVDNALGRLAQQQEMAQRRAVEQQRLGMDQQRLGFDQGRFDQEMKLAPMRLDLQRQQLRQQQLQMQQHERMFPLQVELEKQRIAAGGDELAFKRQMHPLELQMRQKQLEAQKFGTIKEGEIPYVQDPSAPGGMRFLEPPGGGNQKLNPTTQKAIDEADDFVFQTKNALGALKRAKQLNARAYDGFAGRELAGLVNNIPLVGRTQGSLDTVELDNVITNQALQSLRSVFGGNPTEGERKILLDVAGSVNQPREVRQRIFEQAERLAEQRLIFNQQKAEALRRGTYYRPGGQPPQIGDQPQPAPLARPQEPVDMQRPLPRVQTPEDARKLPRGTRFIDPTGRIWEVQ